MVDVDCLWGICGEVSAAADSRLVSESHCRDCKSVAKASKVRILHLPPSAGGALTSGDAGRGLSLYGGGVCVCPRADRKEAEAGPWTATPRSTNPPDGLKTCPPVLGEFDPKVQGKTIDRAKTH